MPERIDIPNSISSAFRRVLESQETNFFALVQLAQLDPKLDFKFANLSGTDFSNSDLRGFDFTGSNLSGCVGVNVNFDNTTNLKDATVDGSCFEYVTSRAAFFKKNDSWFSLMNRLSKDHFSQSVNWIADNLHSQLKPHDEPWYVATRLLEVTQDAVLRSNILYFARPLFKKSDNHLNFLFHLLMDNKNDVSLTRAITTSLSNFHASQPIAFKYLMMLVDNTDKSIRRAALLGICNSSMFSNSIPQLAAKFLANSDEESRRYLLKRVASRLDHSKHDAFTRATTEATGSSRTIDYAKPVSKEQLTRIAYQWVIQDKIATNRSVSRGNFLRQESRVVPVYIVNDEPVISEFEIEGRVKDTKMMLEKIRTWGIPIQFEGN